MTSRRPYWCPKTMKRRPCWCPKLVLWEMNSFLMQMISFVPKHLHRCWPREWKHSIPQQHTETKIDAFVNLFQKKNVSFITEPQDDFFCFIPPSLAAKHEFKYIGIGLLWDFGGGGVLVLSQPLYLWVKVYSLRQQEFLKTRLANIL